MRLFLATSVTALMLSGSIAPAQETEAAPLTADTVVATVDGAEITLGEMIILRSRLPQQYAQLPPEQLFAGIVDQLINQQLLSETLEEVPDRVNTALKLEERSLRAGEVVTDIRDQAATEDEIEAAYAAMFEGAEPTEEYNASHILLDTEEEALEAIALLEDGAEFAFVASERSIGPSAPNGGNLGWFGSGRMVPEFEAAVIALEVGAVSAPVQTDFGWHVIKLNDKRDEVRPSLEELRPQIVNELQTMALEARIEELAGAADITRPAAGDFDPAVLLDFDLLAK